MYIYRKEHQEFQIERIKLSFNTVSKSSFFESICFFNDGLLKAINDASRLFLTRSLVGIAIKTFRSSHGEVFLGKGVLKLCSKFTGEHPRRSVISIKLQSNFIEIALRHGCSPVNLLHIFRTPFTKNTSGRLLLNIPCKCMRWITL